MIYIELINGDFFETNGYSNVNQYIRFKELDGTIYEIPWTSILFIKIQDDKEG